MMKNQEINFESLTTLPRYPESHEDCYARLKYNYQVLLMHYLEKKDNDILIMVTHFLPLETFSKIYHDKHYPLPFEYCLTLFYKYNSENHRPEFSKIIYPKKSFVKF